MPHSLADLLWQIPNMGEKMEGLKLTDKHTGGVITNDTVITLHRTLSDFFS